MADTLATGVLVANQPGIINVEHPGLVQNVDRATASLGGSKLISKFVQSDDPSKQLKLFLNPTDPFRRPIASRMKPVSDIVLKFTVPKRTGRKRKRGSNNDFEAEDWSSESARDSCGATTHLLRSLRDNLDDSKVEAIGVVDETHKFRSLPDFQYSVAGGRLAESLKSSILPSQYEKLKHFQFDKETRGLQDDMDMIPPPAFSQANLPLHYAYHQNPYVEAAVDQTGKASTTNTSIPPSTSNTTAKLEDTEVPQGPPPGLPPIESLDKPLQGAIRQLGELLEERPIITRRVVSNKLSNQYEAELRQAVKYHAYIFRSGPWRDCFVKYGLDPRHSPEYRVYQTLMFHIPIKDELIGWMDGRSKWARSHPATLGTFTESHMFDGKTVVPDSKVWQACDITDPLLRRILDEDGPSDSFNAIQDGWYNNGTWAKVRVIMRDKITLILAGAQPNDADYERYLYMPNIFTKETEASEDPRNRQREGPLASDIRNIARQSMGKLQEKKLKNTYATPRIA